MRDRVMMELFMSGRNILELLIPNFTAMELNLADHSTLELIIAIPIIAEVLIMVLIKVDHLDTEPPAEVLRMPVIVADGLLVADKMPDHMLAWDQDFEIVPERIKHRMEGTMRTIVLNTMFDVQ